MAATLWRDRTLRRNSPRRVSSYGRRFSSSQRPFFKDIAITDDTPGETLKEYIARMEREILGADEPFARHNDKALLPAEADIFDTRVRPSKPLREIRYRDRSPQQDYPHKSVDLFPKHYPRLSHPEENPNESNSITHQPSLCLAWRDRTLRPRAAKSALAQLGRLGVRNQGHYLYHPDFQSLRCLSYFYPKDLPTSSGSERTKKTSRNRFPNKNSPKPTWRDRILRRRAAKSQACKPEAESAQLESPTVDVWESIAKRPCVVTLLSHRR